LNPRIAVLGATGAVGTIVRQLLEERQLPFQSIRFFGSPHSIPGRTLLFQGQLIPVEPLIESGIHDIDLAIASTPDPVAAECVPWVVRQGGVIVDESAHHRMLPNVPLVIPEVNPEALANHQGIIASPNCSTTQMVVCLNPIHQQFGIKRVIVSTYQSASGAGQAAQQELTDGTRAMLEGKPVENLHFERPLPMNLWPRIGSIQQDGSTSEETKMVQETRKILGDDQLPIFVTCVRVPVLNCHSETIVVETRKPAPCEQVARLFDDAAGITVVDDHNLPDLPTPQSCDGKDEVFVGRIRRDDSVQNGIAFWCVSDNLRKGAATNAVQIAELLIRQKLLRDN